MSGFWSRPAWSGASYQEARQLFHAARVTGAERFYGGLDLRAFRARASVEWLIAQLRD